MTEAYVWKTQKQNTHKIKSKHWYILAIRQLSKNTSLQALRTHCVLEDDYRTKMMQNCNQLAAKTGTVRPVDQTGDMSASV